MSRMYILLGGLLLLIIAGVVIYYFFIAKPVAPSELQMSGPFDINTQKVYVSSKAFPTAAASTAFLTDGTGTFQMYVYLDTLTKTGSAVSCGTASNKPSCGTGLYDPCKCKNQYDCTNCSHEGYKQLISLYGVYTLEVLNLPDASRPNSVSAQLTVRTKNSTGSDMESNVETIPLPPLPLQKWILVTITRDGRQVNVLYNDSIVSSSKTQNMIDTVSASGDVVSGGAAGLSGVVGLLRMLPKKVAVTEVTTYYNQTSDTRGAPTAFTTDSTAYDKNVALAKSKSIIQMFCLDLSCFSMPRVNVSIPTNTSILKDTNSDYTKVSNLYNVNTLYS
jgi:hypothetical protein